MKKVDESLALRGNNPAYGNISEASVTSAPESEGERYPSFHFEGPEELHIPAHGTMVVHYCLKKVVQTTVAGGEWYECDIQVKRIISAEEEKDDSPTKKNDETENALDKLARERLMEDED